MIKNVKRSALTLISIFCMSIFVSIQCFGADLTRGFDLAGLLGSSGLSSLLEELGGSASSSSSSDSSAEGLGTLFDLLGITERRISDCKISAITDKTYTGEEITPALTITWNGTRLKKGTDYTVTYTGNIKPGTAKCKITGKGQYKGTKTVSFTIVKGNSSKSGKKTSSGKTKTTKTKETEKAKSAASGKFTVKVKTGSYTYNGKVRKPDVTVTAGNKKVPSSAYMVTYKDNKNVGHATVTVKGKGDYKGYAGEASFRIELKKTSLKSASAAGDGKISCSWNKDTQADGYQIEYCTNKSFKNTAKTVKIQGSGEQSKVLDKLTAGKNYYVRIRSYKKVGSRNWYSEWSAARSVSVK